MNGMKESYIEYYTPLVQQFCRSLSGRNLDGLDSLPQPFLPLFGKGYETSSLRLMVVGQDTRWWGNAKTFIDVELASPGSEIAAAFSSVEDLTFRGWGSRTHSFWGFAMALLASIHGMPNWNVLKWGGHEKVLSSIAWGNVNAVLRWESLQKDKMRVPCATWTAARAAGAHLNRFRHMLTALCPRVVLITVKSLDFDEFFEGFHLVRVDGPDPHIDHYRIGEHDVDVFHTYHPGYMRNVGGPWTFLNRLRESLRRTGLVPDFPEFVAGDESGAGVVDWLCDAYHQNGIVHDKYGFVEWTAGELAKHGAFMSVPTLMQLVNRMGFRTNYGTAYSGGRGSYRLVRGAYYRAAQRGDQQAADQIAWAFRKPDFTYAY